MVTRLLGRKLGMTRIYSDKGRCYPCTVIEAGPCTVLQVKTKDGDGYDALQIGFGARRAKNVPRAQLGHMVPKQENQKPEERKKQLAHHLKDMKYAPEIVREIPWDGKEAVKVGDTLNVSVFETQKRVDIVGTSKGRGFMGVVRRHGFHGLPATHGQSDRERAPGSLGRQHSISQGVYPGKKMAGHWGVEQVTMKNIEVVKVIKEKNLLFVHGAVPGPMGGHVLVKEAHWVPPKPPTVTSKKQHGKVGAKK
ncbi:MAG: 50S ribosomal protein L3 [Planctomycetes bacterium]|nr:50S ribosomal protein L3 [Planctomycetota bacterium]